MEVQVTYADVVKGKKIFILYNSMKESACKCVFLTSLVQAIACFAPRAPFTSNKFDTREKVA